MTGRRGMAGAKGGSTIKSIAYGAGNLNLADLKAAVNFRGLVAETHNIDRTGKVLCPAHADTHPSCHVYQDSAYCFACQWSADHIGWLELVHGSSTKDAIRELRRRAGAYLRPYPTDPRPPAPIRYSQPLPRLPDADRVAAWELEWQRARPGHPLLARYLAARGLSVAPPLTLRIGFYRGTPYMVARVESVNGKLRGLHRTELAPDGSRRRDRKLAAASVVLPSVCTLPASGWPLPRALRRR